MAKRYYPDTDYETVKVFSFYPHSNDTMNIIISMKHLLDINFKLINCFRFILLHKRNIRQNEMK